MTDEQVKAVDMIIKFITPMGADYRQIRNDTRPSGLTYGSLQSAIFLLNEEGLIETSDRFSTKYYRLTPAGIALKNSEKSYADYLSEKVVKVTQYGDKDKLDWQHKMLQIQDLETKLNVINKEQLDFWKSQKQKNVQTTIIALISAVFALISLLEVYGILP